MDHYNDDRALFQFNGWSYLTEQDFTDKDLNQIKDVKAEAEKD